MRVSAAALLKILPGRNRTEKKRDESRASSALLAVISSSRPTSGRSSNRRSAQGYETPVR